MCDTWEEKKAEMFGIDTKIVFQVVNDKNNPV